MFRCGISLDKTVSLLLKGYFVDPTYFIEGGISFGDFGPSGSLAGKISGFFSGQIFTGGSSLGLISGFSG